MAGRHRQNLVRTLVGAALCTALVACIAVPVPEELPAIAIRQTVLYRLEVALFAFYGSLLLIVPAFSGLIRGRLPAEISTRGAKFAEETNQSDELAEEAIEQLRQSVNRLADRVAAAETMLDSQQKGVTTGDRQ